MKCANCGELTSEPSNSDYQRQQLGWCRACFSSAKKSFKNPDLWECHYKNLLAAKQRLLLSRERMIRNRLRRQASVSSPPPSSDPT